LAKICCLQCGRTPSYFDISRQMAGVKEKG
jgi:hypothetical protein